jgi:acetoin utilization protein AcuB
MGKCRELMRIHRVRRLPVLREGHVTGIVTDRDLRAAQVSTVDLTASDAARDAIDAQRVGLICREQLLSVGPDDTLEQAAAAMASQRISGMPVLQDGALVGIITETDVFRALVEVLGFRDHGARIVLDVGDGDPPLWQQLAELHERGLEPTSVVTYRRRGGGTPRAVVRAARRGAV